MAQLQSTTVAGDLTVDKSGGVAPFFLDSANDIVATNFDTSSTDFSTEPTNSNTDILASGRIETQTGFVGDGSGITNFSLTDLSNVGTDGDSRAQLPDLPSISTTTTPSKDSDLTTKVYVDGVAQGLEVKDSAGVATNGTNVDLTSTTDPNPIDGVTVADGDFVLLKDQNTASENGIYEASTATDPTTWTRRVDFDEDDEVQAGAFVFIEKGTENQDKAFVVTTDDPITVGTDDINFSVFSNAGEITAGDGLSKSGQTLSVNVSQIAGTGLQDDGSGDLEIVDEDVQDAIYNNVLSGDQTLITVTYDDANDEVDYVVNNDLSQYSFTNVDTDDIGEGASNLYFTDERAQDAVGTILGSGFDYDDSGDSITLSNQDPKASVRAATDGTNVNLTSNTDPNPIDGVTLSDGDRVLLKDQSTGSENGIYVANTATDPTTWTRATDADDDSEVTTGLNVFAEEGTENGDQGFLLTTDNPITVGTTSLSFSRFTGVQVSAGDGLSKSGDTLNVALGVEDSGTDTVSSAFKFDFGTNLSVTDNTGTESGEVIVDATDTNTTDIDVDDGGTDVATGVDNLDFGTAISVTDNGSGTVTVDGNITAQNNGSDVLTGVGTINFDNGIKSSTPSGNIVDVNVEPADFAGNGLVDDGSDNMELDIAVSDSGSDVTTSTSIYELEFGSGLDVTDNTGTTAGRVSISVDASTATNITVEDSGTDVVSGIDNLDFGTNLSVTDNTGTEAGEAIIDATDTTTDVSEDGTEVVAEVTDINFTTDITVTDDTDGTVTVEHENTGGASDVSSTNGQALDAVTFDDRGHVESVGTTDFDSRYVTESGDTMTGTLFIDSVNNTNTGLFVGDPANDDIDDTTTVHVANGDALFDNKVTANSFVETSTLRLKENVHRLESQMEKIMQLQPVSFDWKSTGERSIGLLAEEVQEIYPELVSTEGGEVQGINYTKLTSVLIDAVKDMKSELDSVKNRI